ncbi:MAG: hypothetical protein J5597_05740 [Spirochaetaceae bacterium]|nr:hypothetical protein [Spirochaetaceae bacterium]
MLTTYKCPNCGGSMVFMPDTQDFKCEYCASTFNEQELAKNAAKEQNAAYQAEPGATADENVNFFSCPNCGAQIVSTGTEMVANCYYCHSSMVQSNADSAEFNPDLIIPFKISREKAKETFLQWVKEKKFVPSDFVSKKQIENITGVYFPYWLGSFKTTADANYTAKNFRTWTSGSTEYTETTEYDLHRKGSISLKNITKKALKKADERVSESVQPFMYEDLIPYSKAYLLGFQAERRDVASDELKEEFEQDARRYTDDMLLSTTTKYASVTKRNGNTDITGCDMKYALLPCWVLTYKDKNGKIYPYTLNGQTGNACGELPVSKAKLVLHFLKVAVPVFLIISAVEWFLL